LHPVSDKVLSLRKERLSLRVASFAHANDGDSFLQCDHHSIRYFHDFFARRASHFDFRVSVRFHRFSLFHQVPGSPGRSCPLTGIKGVPSETTIHGLPSVVNPPLLATPLTLRYDGRRRGGRWNAIHEPTISVADKLLGVPSTPESASYLGPPQRRHGSTSASLFSNRLTAMDRAGVQHRQRSGPPHPASPIETVSIRIGIIGTPLMPIPFPSI